MLAAIRPDSWNYALFLHVLGAMSSSVPLSRPGSCRSSAGSATKADGAATYRAARRSGRS